LLKKTPWSIVYLQNYWNTPCDWGRAVVLTKHKLASRSTRCGQSTALPCIRSEHSAPRRSVIDTSTKIPIGAAISSAAIGLEPFVDRLAVEIDQAQRVCAGRPFGVACASDRPFDIRGTDGRFCEHGCAPFGRRTEELKTVCR
jgi:hypothetical protein